MKLAICDDERRIREVIAEAVREVSESMEIACFADAKGILATGFDADILFLDIQMPGVDGMRAARLLRADGKKMVIIFVTAFEEQVFQAFDVGAFHYVVKPFTKERIKEILKRAMEQVEEQHYIEKTLAEKEAESLRAITVKSGGTRTRVILSEITYAEIFDRQIVLHMNDRDNIAYYGRISELEKMAGRDFFRVHRAYLVNLAYVNSYDAKWMHVQGTDIPVARGKYAELVKAYLSYCTRREGL